MKLIFVLFCMLFFYWVVLIVDGANCPSGGKIYEWGISNNGKQQIVKEHNKYRKEVLKGKVAKQPKGKNIKKMSYDDNLGKLARVVSKTCKMKHVKVSDKRFTHVGQNLYINWSSSKDREQNWTAAADAWFQEHKYFKYPDKKTVNKPTGHYTQMIWHSSSKLGCDYIHFFDKTKPKYPYAKLYTCNYGPGGNIKHKVPYPLA